MLRQLTVDIPLNSVTFYDRSKLSAEQVIQDLSSKYYHVAIIRPPMVYGANNQGNFKTLRKIALSSSIFPKINNERSAIYIDNLFNFIKQVIEKDLQGILFPQNDDYMRTVGDSITNSRISFEETIFIKLIRFSYKTFDVC